MEVPICVCCGKQPGATERMVVIASRPLPETLPEALRGSIPEEDYSRMREARMKAPPIRVGFCSTCDRAGCDGVSPCKVPAEHWESMERHQAEQEAWDKARGFTMFAWRDPNVKKNLIANTSETWTQLADNYWRKLERTGDMTMLWEILQLADPECYQTYVTVLETSNPDYQDRALGSLDASSLEEAEKDCHRLSGDFIEGRVPISRSYSISISQLEEP